MAGLAAENAALRHQLALVQGQPPLPHPPTGAVPAQPQGQQQGPPSMTRPPPGVMPMMPPGAMPYMPWMAWHARHALLWRHAQGAYQPLSHKASDCPGSHDPHQIT